MVNWPSSVSILWMLLKSYPASSISWILLRAALNWTRPLFLAVRFIGTVTMGLLVFARCEQVGFKAEILFHPGVKIVSSLYELADVIIVLGRVAEIAGLGPTAF